MDGRGLLPIDWITIPAAGGNPALTISKDTFADDAVLNALFWQYADGDSGLTLANGVLTGNANSGVFESEALATGTALNYYSNPYILKRLNLDPARASEVNYGSVSARAGLIATNKWHAANRSFSGISKVISSGGYNVITTIPTGLTDVIAISAGQYISLALQSDGTVVAWGEPAYSIVPEGLSGVKAISAGAAHSLALKEDGTVVGWGNNDNSGANIPDGLNNVVSVSAGGNSMALKGDGTVVTWGYSSESVSDLATPNGLLGVVAISAGSEHNMALKSDGTVVAWGSGPVNVPEGLNNVISIAAGWYYSFALKGDGTVVGWGSSINSQPLIPDGLNGVVAISAGASHCLALKNDGTIVTIGSISNTAYYVPFASNTNGVAVIDAGVWHNLLLKPKAQ
jgi:alpha-tubulin suppressor-like RCC1 family protein